MRSIKSSLKQHKLSFHIIKQIRNLMQNGKYTQPNLEQLYNQQKQEKLWKGCQMIEWNVSTVDVNLQLSLHRDTYHYVLRKPSIFRTNLRISKKNKVKSKHSKLENQLQLHPRSDKGNDKKQQTLYRIEKQQKSIRLFVDKSESIRLDMIQYSNLECLWSQKIQK